MTDSDGATNSTFADVTVIKEVDYPPKANAGSNVIISLPQNSVTLYGNSSTDDKGIASYEWNKHEDILTADMQVSIGRSRWVGAPLASNPSYASDFSYFNRHFFPKSYHIRH